ncbi:hypothetical protein [Corynebacterium ureicelerivorans]|uniref:hypothetical protein n=1 Tax=Corynebacterium ureicelerivorans TaxID=401472 RepID=UPI001184CCB8|nr:hypothetical protein [Corynebacterium ureicelerivorans]MCT1369923.1 hypothetical protein [Corynebacterium mucifaciens]
MKVYDPDQNDATEMLLAGLINRDPDARARIGNDMLDRDADPTVVDHGQNTLTLLLSHDDLGEGDAALVQRLVDGGADVDFRESRGDVPIKLAVKIGAESNKQRRPIYEALFGKNVDLDEPSSVRNPKNTIGQWLRMCVDHQTEDLKVMDEFLTARGF